VPERGRVSRGTQRCAESDQHLAVEGVGVEVLRADERPREAQFLETVDAECASVVNNRSVPDPIYGAPTGFQFVPGLLAYADPNTDEGGDETANVRVFNTQARTQLTNVDAGNGAFQPD